MIEMFENLSESCKFVEEHCTAEEYTAYKKATAALAGNIVMEVLDPLYKKNPDLKPAGWDD